MIKDFGEITRHPVVALFFADLSVCLWCSVSFSKVNLPVAFISGRRGRWRKAEGEVREVGQTRGTAWRGIEMREEACKIFRAPITFFFFFTILEIGHHCERFLKSWSNFLQWTPFRLIKRRTRIIVALLRAYPFVLTEWQNVIRYYITFERSRVLKLFLDVSS